ncbi:hypothetical protein LTR27_005632 [Elasticomyces elasticus]|nr:hypothetical protein LTR27_005632 [Elasticomyces elasticus]
MEAANSLDHLRALLFDSPFAVKDTPSKIQGVPSKEQAEPHSIRTDFSSKHGQGVSQPKAVDLKKKAAKLEKRAFEPKKRETELLACEAAAGERETLLALKEGYNKDLANEIDDRAGIVIDWERVLEQREEVVTEREEALNTESWGGLGDDEYSCKMSSEAFARILAKTEEHLAGEQLMAWKAHMAGVKQLMKVASKKIQGIADEDHNGKMKAIGLTLPAPNDEDHLVYSDESDEETVEDQLEYSDDSGDE